MYEPSTIRVDLAKKIHPDLNWLQWVSAWEKANDVGTCVGLIRRAKKTPVSSVPGESGIEHRNRVRIENERWIRALLEICDAYTVNPVIHHAIDAVWVEQEIARAAFDEVMKFLEHENGDTLKFYGHETLKCLFWFFRPSPQTHSYEHYKPIIANSRHEKTLEAFVLRLSKIAWEAREDRAAAHLARYRPNVIELLAASGRLDLFSGPLAGNWERFDDVCFGTLRKLALRYDGITSLPDALAKGIRPATICASICVATGRKFA